MLRRAPLLLGLLIPSPLFAQPGSESSAPPGPATADAATPAVAPTAPTTTTPSAATSAPAEPTPEAPAAAPEPARPSPAGEVEPHAGVASPDAQSHGSKAASPAAAPDVETASRPRDTLSGHFQASLGAGYAQAVGGVTDDLSELDSVRRGVSFELDAAYGISRYVSVGAWGQYGAWTGPRDCSDCSASSMAGGLLARYHLVQGTRFDPWISAGVGYRGLQVVAPDETLKFSGPALVRVRIGGDWYASRNLAFGPYVGLDAGLYTRRPHGTGGRHGNWQLSSGLRLALDVPGK